MTCMPQGGRRSNFNVFSCSITRIVSQIFVPVFKTLYHGLSFGKINFDFPVPNFSEIQTVIMIVHVDLEIDISPGIAPGTFDKNNKCSPVKGIQDKTVLHN